MARLPEPQLTAAPPRSVAPLPQTPQHSCGVPGPRKWSHGPSHSRCRRRLRRACHLGSWPQNQNLGAAAQHIPGPEREAWGELTRLFS